MAIKIDNKFGDLNIHREVVSGTLDGINSMFYVSNFMVGTSTGISGAGIYLAGSSSYLYKNGLTMEATGVSSGGVLSGTSSGWKFTAGSASVNVDNIGAATVGMIVEDYYGTGVARISAVSVGTITLQSPWRGETGASHKPPLIVNLGTYADYVVKGKSIVMRSSYDSPVGSPPTSADRLIMSYVKEG